MQDGFESSRSCARKLLNWDFVFHVGKRGRGGWRKPQLKIRASSCKKEQGVQNVNVMLSIYLRDTLRESVSVLVLRAPHHPLSRRCCRAGPGRRTAPPLNCGYLSRIPFACLLPLLYAAWIFVLQYHFPSLFCMTYLFTVRIALLYIYSYWIRHFLFFIHLVLFF